jgi:hypothetical protein
LKPVILLAFVAIVFIAGTIFATQVSAQYQGQGNGSGGQGYPGGGAGGQGFQGTRTPVNGTYTNSNFGVQVTLPDGWSGFEMKSTSGNTRVMIAPGGYQTGQGVARPPITIGISIMPSSSTQPQMMSRNMQGLTCTNSTTTNTVNGLNLNVLTKDCTGTDTNGNSIETKSKIETAQTSSSNIVLSFRANTSSGYDSQVATFDSMVGSLQIANAAQTPAVPEFPVPAIGLVVAIMIGSVVLLGRTKIFPSGI